jgi:hypothetical protein
MKQLNKNITVFFSAKNPFYQKAPIEGDCPWSYCRRENKAINSINPNKQIMRRVLC